MYIRIIQLDGLWLFLVTRQHNYFCQLHIFLKFCWQIKWSINSYLAMISPLLGGSCPPGWYNYNANCFYVSATLADHPTARTRCQAMDADLASISNQEEMDFIANITWVVCLIIYNGWSISYNTIWTLHSSFSYARCLTHYYNTHQLVSLGWKTIGLHIYERSELCFAKTKRFAEICDIFDHQLFSNIIRNPYHFLSQLLPSVSAAAENYNVYCDIY